MKNSKILVAVMVFMMFSYTKAEEIKLDFDGVIKGKEINEVLKDTEFIEPPTNPVTVDNKVYDEEEIKKIDYSILQTVNYCEKNNVSSSISEGLKKLLVHGTKEEKIKFLLNTQYIIPGRVVKLEVPDITILLRELIDKDKAGMCQPTCVKWESKEVCVNKQICENVCDATTLFCLVYTPSGACAKWGISCKMVCRIIPECVDTPVCVETQTMCDRHLKIG